MSKQFLKQLGTRVKGLIQERGYVSAYDFWIKNPELEMSRVTLNSVLNGKTDVRITNLYKIAKALDVNLAVLVDQEKS